MEYTVDPQLDIPIYRQVADQIRAEIRTGGLPYGTKLPTVQLLARRLDVSRGTAVRAYDELERGGLIEKTQGRGTFVRYRRLDAADRREQGIAAVGELTDRLEELGFSPEEIRGLLEEELQRRARRETGLKLGIVVISRECIRQMTRQLSGIPGIELYPCLVRDFLRYPYELDEKTDLIITTEDHYEKLRCRVEDPDKILRVALEPASEALADMARIRPGSRVGVLCATQYFTDMLVRRCGALLPGSCRVQCKLFSGTDGVEAFLRDKDVLLIAAGFEELLSREEESWFTAFAAGRELIRCQYRIDRGSVLSIEDVVQARKHTAELV